MCDTYDTKNCFDTIHCVICLEHFSNIIFLPCNHLCVCYDCYLKINPKMKCVLCRQKILITYLIYALK